MITKRIILFFTFFCNVTLFAQNTFVFFGSFNRDRASEGIYVYQLDTLSGKLNKVSSVKDVFNPSFLTFSPNGKFIYSCTDSKSPSGTVSCFFFNEKEKTLSFLNSQPSGGVNPVYVSVHKDGKWLINANYTDGSVSAFPLAEDGKIQRFVQNFKYTEGSIIPDRQDSSHVHAAVFSPNFDFVFFPDLGSDGIRVYRFDVNKNEPIQTDEVSFVATTPGGGPRHLAFHPNKKVVYLIEELSGTISVYDYENGVLAQKQRIATHSDKVKPSFESSDVHISPDGKFLYASNRGKENNIAAFSIDENGKLKNIDYTSTRGIHPRVFAIDESGKFLIVTNAVSGNAFVFRRNVTTGKLKKIGKGIKIKSVSSVVIKQYPK